MSERRPDRKCPICGKPPDVKLRPFCSRRCADIDLGRWFKGRYFIPGKDSDEGDRPAISGGSDREND